MHIGMDPFRFFLLDMTGLSAPRLGFGTAFHIEHHPVSLFICSQVIPT